MVQVKKEDLRQAILAAAREQFLRGGYRSASLRAIAQKAGCSPGNIYSYFSDKDALMVAVTRRALERVRKADEALAGFPTEDVSLDFATVEQDVRQRAVHFDKHREDFSLILCKCEGSSAHALREEFLEDIRAYLHAKMNFFRSRLPGRNTTEPSRFFTESVAVNILGVLTSFIERDVPLEDMERYGLELARYDHYGLLAVLEQ
jgi:TetR/AcrR family transcriptional regulator, cholesterol catabolism regulator